MMEATDEQPERLSVTYYGPALAGGRMMVKDLMPTLMALDRLLAESQAMLDPDAAPVHLAVCSVDTDPENPDSFRVNLIVVPSRTG